MASNPLQQAIVFLKAGRKEEARGLLQQIIRSDPHSEIAWLWYIDTLSTNDERIQALEWCLRFNPKSQAALKGLQAFRESNSKQQRGTASSTPPISSNAAPSSPQRATRKYDDSGQSLFGFLESEKWEDAEFFGEQEAPVYFCEECGYALVLCNSCCGYFCKECERRQCNLCNNPLRKRKRPESEKWHRRGFGIVRFVPVS